MTFAFLRDGAVPGNSAFTWSAVDYAPLVLSGSISSGDGERALRVARALDAYTVVKSIFYATGV